MGVTFHYVGQTIFGGLIRLFTKWVGIMQRQRKWIVDGRLKLEEGDKVKVKGRARGGIYKNLGLIIGPHTIGTVEKIQFDIAEKRFFAVVRILGTKLWMPVSDLVYYGLD